MATIVNNPPAQTVQQPADNSNSNWIIAIVLLVLFFLFAVYFGLPILRRAATPAQVNIPSKIDVNVKTPGK